VARIRGKGLARPDAAALRGPMLLGLFVAANVVVFSLITPYYFFRYLAPSVPLVVIFAGRIVESAMRWRVAAGIAALAAILLLSPLRNYLYELSHHYRGPTEAIAAYLNEHASPGDVVTSTRNDLPLKFYTKLRVVCVNTGEDISPAFTARWIVASDPNMAKELQANKRYQRIDLDCVDIPNDNRESPEDHHYRTATGGPPVTIFRRIGP
jgi:hypothetical protein